MFKPIKRIFIPKHLALQPVAAAAPVVEPQPAVASKPHALFEEVPQPEMEEKNSDSIWAVFESRHPLEIEGE